MLHYRNRERSIQIITLNPVFASDVYDRLRGCSGLGNVKILLPSDSLTDIKIEDLQKLASQTTNSLILIFDVCFWSRVRLQQVFSDIIRFNRVDFNEFCYSIVIGDLPTEYIKDQKLYNIHSYLSDIRIDFSPAVFFISPFSLYSPEERQLIMTSPDNLFSEKIPVRFNKYFKEESPSVRQVTSFFRASGVPDAKKPREKRKREIVLKNIYTRMVEEDFPALKEMYMKGLTKEGYSIPGESLKVHLYPFFFEESVLDLINKTGPAY